MNTHQYLSRLHFLFDNDHPDQVWSNASYVITKINPNYDFTKFTTVFRDVVDIYDGEYPGYLKVSTLYHDRRHTMDVFMCAIRLMHGAHLAGKQLSDDEITMGVIATLMHDIGYAQQVGDDSGTGAKYTKTHVARGIAFMRQYMTEKNWPANWIETIESAMLCTDPSLKPSSLNFPNERAHLIAMLVGTADLVGQMADRSYLEKLLFLYFEFKEAKMGDFDSVQDLLARTEDFYKITRLKLDDEFDSTYQLLGSHFKNWFDVDCNYYMESIDKNITYLSHIVQEAKGEEFFAHLKRRGIVQKAKAITPQ